MANNYKIDQKGMKEFVTSQAVGDVMLDAAKEALAYAKSIAPVRSGKYRDSLRAEQVMAPVGKNGEKRASAMLTTDSPYAAVVENKHKVLSRTAARMKGGSR